MKILGIDTSGPVCSAALWADDALKAETLINSGLTHSETLMPALDNLLAGQGLTCSDIDLFAAVAGPGSFTGVRIGICAAKALAQATGRQCARINSLEALAAGTASTALICPILDARRGQVYCAAFKWEGTALVRMLNDDALPLEEFVSRLPEEELVFTGDGVRAYADKLKTMLGSRAVILPSHIAMLRAGAACFLAQTRPECVLPPEMLTPIYLRAPQAERERNERLTRERA